MKPTPSTVNGAGSSEEVATSSEPPKIGEDTPLISVSNNSLQKNNSNRTNDR